MARIVELSGTAEWDEPVHDVAGILVLSPKEFERAVALATATPAEMAEPAPPRRQGVGRVRRPR